MRLPSQVHTKISRSRFNTDRERGSLELAKNASVDITVVVPFSGLAWVL